MRFCSGTLFAFLGCLVVVPEAAVAGCPSHYVPTISLSTGSGLGLEMLNRSGEPAVAGVAETPRAPKPCTGSMCSGRPAVPVSPAPSPVLRIGLWAILEIATTIGPPERTGSLPGDGKACPTRLAIAIFHPPRRSPSHLAS